MEYSSLKRLYHRTKEFITDFFFETMRNINGSHNFSQSTVIILGRVYSFQHQPTSSQCRYTDKHFLQKPSPSLSNILSFQFNPQFLFSQNNNADKTSNNNNDFYTSETISDILHDCYSRIWFSYRTGFFPIKSNLSSVNTFYTDAGWGCMLRSAQMFLAQALICHYISRGWRYLPPSYFDSKKLNELIKSGFSLQSSYFSHNNNNSELDISDISSYDQMEIKHRRIIELFLDSPVSPFSLHRFITHGESLYEKSSGVWFGPAEVCELISRSMIDSDIRDEIQVFVARSSALYKDEITRKYGKFLCKSHLSTIKKTSLVILIPLRLGLSQFTKEYIPSLFHIFQLPYSLGAIGGRPNAAVYFIGFQDERLLYLDPHTIQQSVNVLTSETVEQFHTMKTQSLKVCNIDPCLALGFIVSSIDEFEDFWKCCNSAFNPASGQFSQFPLFSLSEIEPRFLRDSCDPCISPNFPSVSFESNNYSLVNQNKNDWQDTNISVTNSSSLISSDSDIETPNDDYVFI